MPVFVSVASSAFPLHPADGLRADTGVVVSAFCLCFRCSWEKVGVRAGALDLTNTAVWTGSCSWRIHTSSRSSKLSNR